jgi:hypothetical protein
MEPFRGTRYFMDYQGTQLRSRHAKGASKDRSYRPAFDPTIDITGSHRLEGLRNAIH